MLFESLSKFVLTAVAVGFFLCAARLWSPRTAGWLSSLPVIGAPSLLWLHATRGPAVAATASVGSIASVAACAVFIAVYAHVNRRWNRLLATLAACMACVLASLPLMGWTPAVLAALVVAHAAVVLCAATIGTAQSLEPVAARHSGGRDIVATALMAGAVSAVVGLIADDAGPFTAGLFASLPLMPAFVVTRLGGAGRNGAVVTFAAGYLQGLHGRCVFALVFSVLIGSAGPMTATLVSALACAAVIGLLETHRVRLGEGSRSIEEVAAP